MIANRICSADGRLLKKKEGGKPPACSKVT
jgi:hypothetical protein